MMLKRVHFELFHINTNTHNKNSKVLFYNIFKKRKNELLLTCFPASFSSRLARVPRQHLARPLQGTQYSCIHTRIYILEYPDTYMGTLYIYTCTMAVYGRAISGINKQYLEYIFLILEKNRLNL